MKVLFFAVVFLLAFSLHSIADCHASTGDNEETIQGKIDAISLEKSEVTIASADRRVTVMVTPDTQIRVNEKPGKLADLREGLTATVVFSTTGNRHNAKSIRVEALFD